MELISSNGLGANAYFWKQNIISSTTYTNVDGIDDDITQKARSSGNALAEMGSCTPGAAPVPALHLQPDIYFLWIFSWTSPSISAVKIYTAEAWKMSLQGPPDILADQSVLCSRIHRDTHHGLGWRILADWFLTMNTMMG